MHMAGVAIITEACIDTKDRACVDVCPVQCIYEFDPAKNQLFSEERGRQRRDREHPRPEPRRRSRSSSTRILYVNTEECTSCTACYQPDVCPVGAIYTEEHVPDGTTKTHYNATDPNKGHDHTFFIQLSRRVRRLSRLAWTRLAGRVRTRSSPAAGTAIGLGRDHGRAMLVDAGRAVRISVSRRSPRRRRAAG